MPTGWDTWNATGSTTLATGGYWFPYSTATSTTAATLTVTYTSDSTGWWDDRRCLYNLPAPVARILTPAEVAEQTAQREADQARWDLRDRQRRAVKAKAVDRATRTLLELLDPTQRDAYLESRVFEVVGSLGNRYRIRPGSSGNVDWLEPADPAEVAGVLCAHPTLRTDKGRLPDPDVALAQMLALTTDEADFLRTANVHRGQRPPIAA